MKENIKNDCPKNQKNYVSNKDMILELENWKNSAPEIENRIISDKLALQLYTISQRLCNHYKFRGYPEFIKEEFVSVGVTKALASIKCFDPTKCDPPNPFAYFTQVIYNAFVGVCSKYYKQKNYKREYLKEIAIQIEENDYASGGSRKTGSRLAKILEDYMSELEGENVSHEQPEI